MGSTTKMIRIDLIAGARPNFMKIAPIIRAIEKRSRAGSLLDYRLIHTGQHYDVKMSGAFFQQLGIPEPHENLDVRSGSQAEQTGKIMVGYEQLLDKQVPDVSVVVGDVTSTMACAIAASKMMVPVAHVEAGIRSGDWAMPEEINRIVTDAISRYFFTTSRHANENLKRIGVPDEQVYFVGNTMIDTLLHHQHDLRPPVFWDRFGLSSKEYVVLTLHRPSNVDDSKRLECIVSLTAKSAGEKKVVFPVHPRTAKKLLVGAAPTNLVVIEPQPYFEFNYLVKHSAAVVTDSGGITEETTVMNIPCITVRNSTERPETVEVGTNRLIGTDPSAIAPTLRLALSGEWPHGRVPELWDGRAGERIVEVLEGLPRQ